MTGAGVARWFGGAVAAGSVGATAYACYRAGARRWQADEEQLRVAGDALPADVEHHFVRLDDGGRLHVLERGSGPPVVLLHGITLSAAIWAPQLRTLADGHRVLAVDQRGHGQSLAGSDEYSIDRLARDLLQMLEDLDVRSAVLAGHSMGGMVALQAAARSPSELAGRVSSLVLMATTGGPVVQGPAPGLVGTVLAAAGRASLLRVERRGKGLLPGGDMGTWIARANFGRRPLAADVELTRSVIAAMPPRPVASLAASLLAFDVRSELPGIEVPARVLVGGSDRFTPPRAARSLAEALPNASLVVYPGAGHMLMLERSEEVTEVLSTAARAPASSASR
jgi:non-heme chloroperoxidase